MHAAGGLGTSILDAARWLELFLADGSLDGRPLLAPATVADMLAAHVSFAEPRGRLRIDQGFGLGWQRGTYRPGGPLQFRHGGSYEGAAAEFTFLPERGIGVAVLANAGGPGNGLVAMVQVDVLDRLLAVEEPTDLLPSYSRSAAKQREQVAFALPNGPAPAAGLGLSLDPKHYVGLYRHPDQGVAEIMLEDGNLRGRIGDLPLTLHAAAVDSFSVSIVPGMLSRGRFEIEDGRVQGLWLQADGDELTLRPAVGGRDGLSCPDEPVGAVNITRPHTETPNRIAIGASVNISVTRC
ncbi:MAG: serine hydrolase [bacterium]|nr:serine hydrolase [bacterium]